MDERAEAIVRWLHQAGLAGRSEIELVEGLSERLSPAGCR